MQQYTRAIVRQPGKNFADGITNSNLGIPDYKRAATQHDAYCKILQNCGVELHILPPDEQYPDGCFVEDTAIIIEEAAIITEPGDPRRQGEEEKIAELLSAYRRIEKIKSPGTLDGGDILRAGRHFYIGISQRTNNEGAKQLTQLLDKYGYTSSEIPVKEALHLKTGAAYIGNNHYIAVPEFSGFFPNAEVFQPNPQEEYAANCLRVNDYLIIPKGFSSIYNYLKSKGFKILEADMSEFRKMDGGLTCLSLLF